MKIEYKKIGVCGLSCVLCPSYQTSAISRCEGCKSKARMAVGCPFITCAVKKRGIEFCWDCPENDTCDKWKKHRDIGRERDSFKCYQKLEDDIRYIRENGVDRFAEAQRARERLLKFMLEEFNEGRSRSYYCIAATILTLEELEEVINEARKKATGLDIKARSRLMHTALDNLANRKNYYLKLRK